MLNIFEGNENYISMNILFFKTYIINENGYIHFLNRYKLRLWHLKLIKLHSKENSGALENNK